MPKPKKEPRLLMGWQQIAEFLGQPISVAQRWSKSGMPVTRERRHVQATPEALSRGLGPDSAGEPVQIATETTDLVTDLRLGLSYVRKQGRGHKKQATSPLSRKCFSELFNSLLTPERNSFAGCSKQRRLASARRHFLHRLDLPIPHQQRTIEIVDRGTNVPRQEIKRFPDPRTCGASPPPPGARFC